MIMRKILYIVSLVYVSLFMSCDSSDIMKYEEASGIYFNGSSTGYSFVENINNKELGSDTIKIPVMITGFAKDFAREVKIEVDKADTLHTASDDMFEILSGEVPANEYYGYVSLKVNYTKALDDSVYVARFKMLATEFFPVTDLNGYNFGVSITNKFTQPANWGRLRSTFGEYSNSWYTFILKETGLSSIPYWSYNGSADANNPDPERWTMTYVEMKAYAAKVKVALADYNNDHPGNPLKHEDGQFKGQIITMK